MKIVCISDTHGFHDSIELPKGDILIHAGDMSRVGHMNELRDFNTWLGEQDFAHKLVIAGNHDMLFESGPSLARSLMTNCTYLQDSSVTIDGIKFYGAPWQPEFFSWAFNLPRGPELAAKWAQIPDDTNVLITHGPPYGFLDMSKEGIKCGCRDLVDRIKNLTELKLHVYGHIHEGHGTYPTSNPIVVNASTCNRNYQPINPPIVIEL